MHVEFHLDCPTRVGAFVFPRKKQPACLIEVGVMVAFPAGGWIAGGRDARKFLVSLAYVLVGTSMVTEL